MKHDDLMQTVINYYNARIFDYGPSACGVDWNSEESQTLRFDQLMKVVEELEFFSVNDYGCGYGALIPYMHHRKYNFVYLGFDIAEGMIEAAETLHGKYKNCKFTNSESQLAAADYTISSGVFNVKLQVSDKDWERYLQDTLQKIDSISKKGFAFNLLTHHADPSRMRSDLYYADPLYIFDFCRKKFSRHVALLHDYPLYEFTILVRK